MKSTDVFRRSALVATVALALTLAGCQADSAEQSGQSGAGQSGGGADASDTGAFFTMEALHSVSIEFSDADYRAMLDAFADSGSKEWIRATVSIDGNTFTDVGLRLKGNSSLRGLRTTTDTAQSEGDAQSGAEQFAPADEGDGQVDPDNPQTMPWLIRLDKYVEGQSYSGRTDFVVRGNNSQTSLNEALSLVLLYEAGVPTQQAAYARFSVNGSTEQLRLIVDVPDDALWNQDNFGGTGSTYKAEAEGDYSYRGDDPAAYLDVFEQKYGAEDLAPLIEFLDFVNNSTDSEFASGLESRLDVEGFATYLAVQELIGNTDDIDGPGNNSYLHFDPETGRMAVVSWDHNLAFGGMGGMAGGGPGGFPGGAGGAVPGDRSAGVPDWAMSGERPEPPEGMPGDFEPGAGNVLAARFRANEQFAELIAQKTQQFTADLFDSGFAGEMLNLYAQLLVDQASDLVDPETIQQEVESIEAFLSGDAVGSGIEPGQRPGGQDPTDRPQSGGAQSA